MINIIIPNNLKINLFDDIYEKISLFDNGQELDKFKNDEIKRVQTDQFDKILVYPQRFDFTWNIFIDFFDYENLQSEINQLDKYRDFNKLFNNTLISNKFKSVKLIDTQIVTKEIDIVELLFDFISVGETSRFPNNLDLTDFINIIKDKSFEYQRKMDTQNYSDYQNIQTESTFLFHYKTNEIKEKAINQFCELTEKLQNNLPKDEIIGCILQRYYSEISTFVEI